MKTELNLNFLELINKKTHELELKIPTKKKNIK